eukprot:c22323_g1_i1 orf=46-2157(+)
MSKSWAIGAWAAEAEREEAEEKERAAVAAAAAAAAPMEAFPPLGESASAKPKKKKPQTFSLAELTIGKSVAHGSRSRTMSDSRGLTTQEMMSLPTGPRDRSGEEEQRGALGGAFRDYRDYNREDRDQNRPGYERDREGSGFLRDREREEPSRADDSSDWSSSKKHVFPSGFDGERRGSRLADRDPPPPSRADEAGNWGLVKKSLPLTTGDPRASGRRETFDDNRQNSRADDADNWVSSKKSLPPPLPRSAAAPGHDAAHVHSRADGTDNWSFSKKIVPMETKQDPHMQDAGVDSEGRWGRRAEPQQLQGMEDPQRRRLVIAPRSRQSSPPQPGLGIDSEAASDAAPALMPKIKSNPFGSARPREAVLADRGQDLPVPKDESGLREQDSRPSSSHSSRLDTSEVTQEPTVQARRKVNPFGNAKPREVLLQEQGKDWQKMDFDFEHRGVDRPETEEEMMLKQEIQKLTELSKKEKDHSAQQTNGVVPDEDMESQNIFEELRTKEKQLEELVRALDDKVRFSQKAGDRPGSRSGRSDAGRTYDLSDRPGSRAGSRPGSRPGSRSGRSDGGRNYDLLERPGSQSGRRNFDSSESPRSPSGYGGGRNMESSDRWQRAGPLDSVRNQEGLERMGSWAGSSGSGGSFDSLQRPRRRPGGLPTEVGGVSGYPQEFGGPDIWTRSNESSRNNRQGSWVERGRVNDRVGTRRL